MICKKVRNPYDSIITDDWLYYGSITRFGTSCQGSFGQVIYLNSHSNKIT